MDCHLLPARCAAILSSTCAVSTALEISTLLAAVASGPEKFAAEEIQREAAGRGIGGGTSGDGSPADAVSISLETAAAIGNITEAGKALTELPEASDVKAATGRAAFILFPGSYQFFAK